MCEYCGQANHRIPEPTEGSGTGTGGQSSGSKPTYTVEQIAQYLYQGYWEDTGRTERSYDVQSGGELTVNLSGLNATGKDTARKALESWTAITGIDFVETTGSADMTFDDNNSGAYASSSVSNGTILSSSINVDSGWSQYGNYYLQTYIHEIGHALGLGHTGNYNGSASYGSDAHFANDSWQMSIMSYFSQQENTSTNASFAYLATAQLADIAAVHHLYGTPVNVEEGNTTYGDGHTTGRFGMDLTGGWAVSIVDSGGTDVINLASRSNNQTLDLGEGAFSSINGKTGNFSIALGTVIENATTGSGTDDLTGNAADNRLESGAGNDQINAKEGNDILIGGQGADMLTGGTGADRFVYTALDESGDSISDFDLAAGDRVDITALLDDIGYTGDDAAGDGVVSLQAGTGGSWLKVTYNGSSTLLVFLSGVADTADVSAIINSGDTPPPPPPPSADNTYTFSDGFIQNWTNLLGTVTDTNGGIDTLDLTSVTLNSTIKLTSGEAGKIGTKGLTINNGSVIENVLFGSGNDKGYGNEADNLLAGNDGNDMLFGGEGNDTLTGGEGKDKLYGGLGDDSLTGGEGDDMLTGGDGNDSLVGGDGKNALFGGLGDDLITSGEGKDKISGGEGNNTINAGDGDNKIETGSGDDVITSGQGKDQIKAGDGNNIIDAGDGPNKVLGGTGDDVITTGDDKDQIKAGEGNNTINAGHGINKIDSGEGDDAITTGDDKDTIKTKAGNNTINAGHGDNKVSTGEGDDRITTGNGKDQIKISGGNNIIFAGDGDNKISTGAGDDHVTSGDGKTQIKAGEGDDTIIAGDGDIKITGGEGDDHITSGKGKEKTKGGDGNDTIYAGNGDKKLDGGDGDDEIVSGNGIVQIKAGAGNDTISAGDGTNKLDGSDGDDILVSGNGHDQLKGGNGNDTMSAGDGDDKVDGGNGDDYLDGDDGNDQLKAGNGDDFAFGGAGHDTIDGGTGSDWIEGGLGKDDLKGGKGVDVFVFNSAAEAGDTIQDFKLADGDMLSIDDLLLEAGTNVNDALASGQLFLGEGKEVWLKFDADGVGGDDALNIAYLKGVKSSEILTDDWFL